MYLCPHCQRPINSASALCPYCGAAQTEPGAELAPEKRTKSASPKLIVAAIVAVVGIWAIIWFALPLRIQDPRPAAERSALEAVQTLQRQLATYQNGASAYPTSLEALGQPARDAGQIAMSGGYSVHYAPSQLDAEGNPHAYTLVVLPQNYGYESLFVDQSGIIRFTRDNRPATLQDPPLK